MQAERSKEKLTEYQRLNPHSETILSTLVIPSGRFGELRSWALKWEHAVIVFVLCNDLHNFRYSLILENFVTHTTMQELSPPKECLNESPKKCLSNRYNSASILVPFHHVNTWIDCFSPSKYLECPDLYLSVYVSANSAETSNLGRGRTWRWEAAPPYALWVLYSLWQGPCEERHR